jgi:peroxin-7
MLSLDFEGKDVVFSTKYKDICCIGTFDTLNWFHSGSLYLCNTRNNTIMTKLDNRIGIHKLSWSEKYSDIVITANHNGTFHIWDVNQKLLKSTVVVEEGYATSCINWNNIAKNDIIVGSVSSRIHHYDVQNLDKIVTTFSEHTKSVYDVKWNPNNTNEFASSSEDGFLRIWDKRQSRSISSLSDRKDMCPLKGIDWHKRDDWIISVATSHDKFLIWDVRNSLQPIKLQLAHAGIIYDIKFDTTNPDNIATCGKDRVVRIWDTKSGIQLLSQHKLHQSKVNAIDWNIHNPNVITSVGYDAKCITSPLTKMSKL